MQPGKPNEPVLSPQQHEPDQEANIKLATRLVNSTALSNWMVISIPFLCLGFAILFIDLGWGTPVAACFVGLIVSFIYIAYKLEKNQKIFRKKYREIVIQPIIKNIDAGVVYEPSSYISSKAFASSGLFNRMPNIYEANNYISKTYPSYTVEYSYVFAKHQGAGERSTPNIMFDGLVLMYTLPKNIDVGIIIRKDTSHGFLAFLDDEQKETLYGSFDHVEIQNEKFEYEFEVYATDKNKCIGIIDESLIQVLIKATKLYHGEIQLSVLGNYAFTTIQNKQKCFHPGLVLGPKPSLILESTQEAKVLLAVPDFFNEVIEAIIAKG